MVQTFTQIFISGRPKQWLKNLSLFVGIIFSGWLFLPEKFLPALQAFICFCLLSSTVYIFNDILDIERDRIHPLKKKRPIASGRLPLPTAIFAIVFGFFLSLFIAVNISFFFFLTCLLYFLLHFSYTLYLKQIPILDVLAIASGFILRVWAGAVAVDAHISVWLLLCVVSFSLFMAVGKRRCEATLLKGVATKHRQALLFYSEKLLDVYTTMFATAAWLTYALFTFSQPLAVEQGRFLSLMATLPRTLVAQKWQMATVPLVIYGIMRYLQLIFEGKGGSPEDILLTDRPLIITVSLWALLTILIIYI
jgi:4-hydroxybenzoate polyprenyltransferase